eukprot:TRINITY_DN11616_c0_g1_i1.p1 TRINITY_DN11616_c0_g1~~TRINITY_DN11616_c0_g1_i1.p1  ORF type:complete len:472 (+),score=65.16 TRINITY_DN11616_c0_g1_i1:76-1491(+)
MFVKQALVIAACVESLDVFVKSAQQESLETTRDVVNSFDCQRIQEGIDDDSDVNVLLGGQQISIEKGEFQFKIDGDVPLVFAHLQGPISRLQEACQIFKETILTGITELSLSAESESKNENHVLRPNLTLYESYSDESSQQELPQRKRRLIFSTWRHELSTFSEDNNWLLSLDHQLVAIYTHHALRLRWRLSPAEWISQWRLMLEHMLMQILVIALQGCLDSIHLFLLQVEKHNPEFLYTPRSSCEIRSSGTWAANEGLVPYLQHYLDTSGRKFKLPRVFFNEIAGDRRDVLLALLNGVVPELAEVNKPAFLEVGIYDGKTAQQVLSKHPEINYTGVDVWNEIFACDTCTAEDVEGVRMTALHRIRPFALEGRAEVFHDDSLKVMQLMPNGTVDIVFIDADHRFPGVYENVREAVRVVRPGGVIAGHDFSPFWFETIFGVLMATCFSSSSDLELSSDAVWWLQRPRDLVDA